MAPWHGSSKGTGSRSIVPSSEIPGLLPDMPVEKLGNKLPLCRQPRRPAPLGTCWDVQAKRKISSTFECKWATSPERLNQNVKVSTKR